MNSKKPQMLFEGKAHTGVMQDKYPPGRIYAGSLEPATALRGADIRPRVSINSTRSQDQIDTQTPAENRPKHHGSEKRQTQQVSGRVKQHIKSEVARVAKLKGWTESRTVAHLIEQALAGTLAQQFGVMLKATIQDAVTKQMQKENNRAGNLALEAFYSAEEGRILTIYLIRLLLGSDVEVLPQIIKDSQDQARENVNRALHTTREHNN